MLRDAAQGIGTAACVRIAGIQTLISNTRLILFAFLVAATANGTVSFQTGQSAGTLTVIQASNNANIASTFLAIGAILRVTTRHTALSIVAQLSTTIHIPQALGNDAGTAILGRIRDGLEAQRATADWFAIDDLTVGISSTGIVAGIQATSAGANRIRRTVSIAVGTLSVGTTAAGVGFGFAHKQGWTLATGTFWGNLANCCGMATAGGTAALLDTGHLGQRISPVPGWALAHRTMIFGQANGILATGFLIANIVAGVCHAVAHLTGRTIVVVDTRNTLATVERIIRIAGVRSGWALTLSLMIIGNANGAWSALDALAGGTTAQRLCCLILDAGLRLRALRIAATLMFPFGLAAIAIVGITHESAEAIATSLMLASNTNRVRRAGEGIANGNALEHAQHVGTTVGGVGAVFIAGTVGQRGFLTGRDHWVPDVAIGAVAYGMAGGVNLAQLVGTADHVRAEIDAFACALGACLATETTLTILVSFAFVLEIGNLAFQLATYLQIAGITKVTIGADTRRTMIVGDAERVGSALNFRAGIDALAQSLAQLETDLRVSTVGIVAALSTYTAALGEIMRISNVAQGTQTFTSITNGARTASRLRAQILADTRLTTVAIGTLDSITALTPAGILAEPALDGLATAVGVTRMANQAETLKAAGRVQADRIQSTRFLRTFIHILATHIGITIESLRANTCDLITRRTTLRIRATTVRLANVLVLRTTSLIGITIGAGITGAKALAKSILAVGILAAMGRTLGLLDGWHTEQIGIANKVGLADTFSIILIAGGSDAADDAVAALLAAAIDADLTLLAGTRSRTLIRTTAAAGEGITQITLRTLAGRSFACRYTQCSFTADDILALRDTIPVGVLDESHATTTPARMLFRLAVGIRSAEQTGTWTKATAIQAGQIAGTILVAGAAALGRVVLENAATLVRISSESLRTHALIAALLVDTVGTIGAGQMSTLILIGAAEQGISLEARLAHALWRIRGRALGIDATWETLAGTLALIVILRVEEVRWRTHALTRLDALLVARTLLIRCALALRRCTESVVGIALVSLGTVAAVATLLIDALRSVGTELGTTFLALVDIHAATVRLRLVTLGAGTVANTAGNRNALGSNGAGLSTRAAGEHATVAEQLVRRLALALGTAADFAHDERIAGMSLWAATLVAAGQILAERVEAAGGFATTLQRTLIHILTLSALRMPLVALSANAYAAAREGILHAALAQRTWVRLGAVRSSRGDATLTVCIARRTAGTLAQVTACGIAADGFFGARIGATLIDVAATTGHGCVARVARSAEALRLPVGQHALRMGTTVTRLAGMTTIVAHVGFGAQAALRIITDGIAGTLLACRTADNGHTTH